MGVTAELRCRSTVSHEEVVPTLTLIKILAYIQFLKISPCCMLDHLSFTVFY